MDYDAVVFDNDGILVELTDRALLRPAIRTAFERCGVADPEEADLERLFDVDVEDVRAVADEYDLDPSELWCERDEAVSAAQVSLLREGRKPLYDDVEAIQSLPAPRGIVSNNQHATVQAIVEHYDLGSLFEVVHGRRPTLTDVDRKKPDPYYLDLALEALSADRALFVGDSPKDLLAAENAGIDAAFVRRSHRADASLPVEPAFDVADLRELAVELE